MIGRCTVGGKRKEIWLQSVTLYTGASQLLAFRDSYFDTILDPDGWE